MINFPFSKNHLFLILTFFPFNIKAVSQNLPEKENDTIIVWTKERKLNWSDFQLFSNDEASKAAESMIGIDLLSIPINDYDYKYVVFSYFYKKSSSVKTTDSLVLKHEQLHFDIAELFARKMRKKLEQLNMNDFDADVYNNVIDAIYDDYFLYQDNYDKETKHSINKEQQIVWQKKVAAEMQKLSNFNSKIFK